MKREEADGLLAIAREAKLLGPDAKSWTDRLAPKRQDFVEAVRFLAENGDNFVCRQRNQTLRFLFGAGAVFGNGLGAMLVRGVLTYQHACAGRQHKQ